MADPIITNPRSLAEITTYRDLLNSRDNAMKIITPLLELSDLAAETALAATTTAVSFKPSTAAAVQSNDLNKYLALWVKKNLKSIAPEVIALMEDDINYAKARAQIECGLNGIESDPIIVPPPVITSPVSQSTMEREHWGYQITADNITGNGINSLAYAASNLPAGATLNPQTGMISWTVPVGATASSPYTFSITVITNIGSDTKNITLTVSSATMPMITTGQTFSGTVDEAITPYQVKGQNVTTGSDGVTAVSWSATGLPDGLTIDADTGIISGTPGTDTDGSHSINVTVTTNRGSSSGVVDCTISAA